MTKKHQVRLDADVAEALGRDAARKGTSLNVAANVWLRRALGLAPGFTPPPVKAEATPDPKPNSRAVVVPAKAAATARCTHPARYRLGPHCTAPGCGVTLDVKPGPRP